MRMCRGHGGKASPQAQDRAGLAAGRCARADKSSLYQSRDEEPREIHALCIKMNGREAVPPCPESEESD